MSPDSDLRDRVTRATDAMPVSVPPPEQALRKGRWRRIRRATILPIVVALAVGGVAWGIVGLTDLGRSAPHGDHSPLNPAPATSHGIAVAVQQRFPRLTAFDIYIVDPNDGSYTSITPDDAMYLSPAWSPDGSQLAVDRFVRHGTTVEDGIYVMNADGTHQTRVLDVTTPRVIGTGQIQWSPDGSQIAFVRVQRFHGGFDAQWIQQLMVMNADGSNLHAVTQPEDGQVQSFSWSPDGGQFVFTKQFQRTKGLYGYDLYVVPTDGGRPVALTNDGRSLDPAWSPDGTRIAFVSYGERMDFRRRTLYLMNADGTGRIRLTADGTPDDDPTWSPDGTAIAFVRDVNDGADSCRIMSVRPDGSGEREILGGARVGGCFGPLDW